LGNLHVDDLPESTEYHSQFIFLDHGGETPDEESGVGGTEIRRMMGVVGMGVVGHVEIVRMRMMRVMMRMMVTMRPSTSTSSSSCCSSKEGSG